MARSINVTLYYAHWCGHCVDFMEEWGIFKSKLNNLQKANKHIEIKINQYEDKELEPLGGGKINGKDIEGFPTIKFGLINGKEEKEYEYVKQRKGNLIANYVQEICNEFKKLKK